MALVKGTDSRTGKVETVRPRPKSSGPDHLTRPAEYRPLPRRSAAQAVFGPVITRPALAGPVAAPVVASVRDQIFAPQQPVQMPAVFGPVASNPQLAGPVAAPVVAAMQQPVQDLIPTWQADPNFVGPLAAPAQGGEQWIGSNMSPNPALDAELNPWVARNEATNQRIAEGYAAQAKQHERLQKRAAREKADRKEHRQELTWEEWNAYTPEQQAAVQANADLNLAVNRDRRWQGRLRGDNAPTPEQRAAYEKDLELIFGTERARGYGFGGVTYAPNTLAFLKERDIKGLELAGRTLDDFLSKDVLMSKKVIDNLGQEIPEFGKDAQGRNVRGGVNQRERNILFAQALAKGQMAYQEELRKQLERGDALLNEVTGRRTVAAANEQYGAMRQPKRLRATEVPPNVMSDIDGYMEFLARPDVDMGETLSKISLDLDQKGVTPEARKQVYDVMLDYTRQAMTGEGDWFSAFDYTMREPGEVAAALGGVTMQRPTKEAE